MEMEKYFAAKNKSLDLLRLRCAIMEKAEMPVIAICKSALKYEGLLKVLNEYEISVSGTPLMLIEIENIYQKYRNEPK